jgi:CheY-like chemotaxis protein
MSNDNLENPDVEEHPDNLSHLYDEAEREAERHKWIESEKAGHDLGENAIKDWHRNFWRSWCRERWVEHLHGERFWIELDKDDYGLLKKQFHDNLELAEAVMDRIKQGGENLDIIQWATEEGHDLEATIEVLKILDINARRIAPPDMFENDFTEEDPLANSKDRKRRILIVDDDDDTRILLNELFQNEGLDCFMASSGEEAIELTQKHRFDCFLIDIMLPGKHGAEVAWYLRRHGINAPILAISAVLDKWNEDDLYDCGFSGLLAKPFDIKALRELAYEIINSK